MKGLFIVFHGFSAHNGISKKILYQRKALEDNGVKMGLCYIDIASDGTQRRMIDDVAIDEFGCGLKAKINKRLSFCHITHYIQEHGIDFIYIRYDHNANPILISWLARVKTLGVKIALEIPTYPYDKEFIRSKPTSKAKLLIEKCFRRQLMRHVDKIVTFSNDTEIFGRPTIRISNGIDFSQIKVKEHINDTSKELKLIGVADIHFWHGFDRVIEGLGKYYNNNPQRIVKFHIVGNGTPAEIGLYKSLIIKYGLENHISLLGAKAGEELDAQFEQCDMGIASLGRHRNGITHIKPLKNREYASRGIPFVYSEIDDDFEQMPYITKVSADDSPIDIEHLVKFYDSVNMSPTEIRATIIDTLSWRRQMAEVLNQL